MVDRTVRMGTEVKSIRVPRRVWFGSQISIVLLVGGNHTSSRHALFRALIIASALSVVPLLELTAKNHVFGDHGAVDLVDLGRFVIPGPKLFFHKLVQPFWGKIETEKYPQVVIADLDDELMGLKLLHYDAKILCIGQGSDSAVSGFKEMGFSVVQGVPKHPLFSFFSRKHVNELELSGDKSFDFVLCGDVDHVASPALLVLEMERVLKPGGTGAVLVSTNANRLVKSVTSGLKQSEIVRVNNLDKFTVIVFKRNVTETAYCIGKSQLPRDCKSVDTNRPYTEFMEPLLEQKPADFPKSVAYLPKFLDLSLKKSLVYIDIGAAEHMDANLTPNWFFPLYPLDSKAFNVYFVDHNTSVMLSYVKKPGVTFVYHPDLAENNSTGKKITPLEQLEPFPEDERFDFLAWFEETAKYADFVVLKMNTNQVEMKFLTVLLETGVICYVDELFLRCSNHKSDCINMLQTLRARGVFVHQWWED
ncbi:putative methyltransferase type 11, S-adenosyl-L-methionine-dependent methyltransferase [Arabidopsis thaliana]|uniref:Methyltransferase type 11 n=2 Tax=Arabidopsis TaxID=3701 RepID=A0A8T2DCL6_ARASU|nr:Methyltransferase type 11 [Arabidopsis thaliana x Arabidopsis arenosa]KAG7607933.1 Methyltransferase type 11 [Arabidopsis suecica]